MSAPAFTPGPWSASAPDGSYHDVIRIFADADPEGAVPVTICPQRNSAIMEVLKGSSDSTTEAAQNAHLIAAAPELYEALEELAERADNFSASGVYFSEPCMTAEVAALEKAWAALAKARGDA